MQPAQPQEHDVLIGLLCTQLGFASPEQVARATTTPPWPGLPLADTLLAQGTINPGQRALIESMARGALEASGGSFAHTLQAFGGARTVAHSFAGQLGLTASGQLAPVPPTPELTDDELAVTLEHVGRYDLERGTHELGRGGIGRVLVTRDKHLGRDVAVKELLPDKRVPGPGASAGSLSTHAVRFLREARVTGQLEHPNIVPVYELGSRRDGTLYYTMKVVRGRTLQDALASCKSLSERLALLPHFVDLCNAIAYAHSRGVIHRDIKPGNVMLGEFGETVVLDWGLAKVHGVRDLRERDLAQNARILHDATPSYTHTGDLLGTPLYMSPEQASGNLEAIDTSSDVWSLGAVLYEILTGRRAFAGGTLYEVVYNVLSGAYPPVHQICPEAPRELSAVVAKALQKDKAQRYPDARQLAAEVNAYLTGGRVGAYEYGLRELLGRFARKHKAALAVSLVAALLLAVLAVSSYMTIREQRDRAAAARSQAETLVSFLLVDMREKLESLGRLDLLDDVCHAVKGYYEKAPADTPRSRHHRADAMDLLGGIMLARGDLGQAITTYEEARGTLRALVEAHPERSEYLDTLAEVERHLGGALLDRGDLEGAARAFDAALAAEKTLTERDPSQGEWQLDLSKSLAALADLNVLRGDLTAAEALERNALELRTALAKRAPDKLEWRAYLASSHQRLGELFQEQGRLTDAETSLRAALAIRTELDRSDPSNTEWKRALSGLYSRIGSVQVARGSLDDALASLETAARLTEELTRTEPNNRSWQRDLAVRHERLGDVHLDRGNVDIAEASFTRSLAIMTVLAEQDPTNLEWQRDLVVSYNRMGEIHARKNALGEAEAAYRKALALMERLVAKAPTNAAWRRDLVVGYNRVGDMLLQRSDLDGAEAMYRQALAITMELAAADSSNAEWRRDIAFSHTRLGELFAQRDNLAAARSEYEAARAIFAELTAVDASHIRWRDDLRIIEERLAALGAGRPHEAQVELVQRHEEARMGRSKPSTPLQQDNAAGGVRAGRSSDALEQENLPPPAASAPAPPEPTPSLIEQKNTAQEEAAPAPPPSLQQDNKQETSKPRRIEQRNKGGGQRKPSNDGDLLHDL